MRRQDFYLISRGFTVMELAIMIVVLLVFFMAAIPKMSNKVATANGQAQKLASDIRTLRFMAQTKNTRYRINFSGTQYTTTSQDGVTSILLPNATSNTNVVPLDAGMSLSTTNIPSGFLVFDSVGRPYTDAATPGALLAVDATVTITYGSDTATLTIHKNTGVVE